MTAPGEGRRIMQAAAMPRPPAAPGGDALAAWNRALNETHAMATMRARAGVLVRAIEERRRRLVATRVLAGPHTTVVDVGCEDGWVAEAYAPAVARLHLVDLDPAVLAVAAERLPQARTWVAEAGDAVALARGLPAGAVDAVVASALLEHVPDPDAVLAACASLLAPHGRIVVFVPADTPILAAKAVLRATRLGGLVRGLSLDPAPGHVRTFDRRSLARLLRRHGRVSEIAFDPRVLGYVGVLAPFAPRRTC